MKGINRVRYDAMSRQMLAQGDSIRVSSVSRRTMLVQLKKIMEYGQGFIALDLSGWIWSRTGESLHGEKFVPLRLAMAADRLYLLWVLEEHISSSLSGNISYEHALKTMKAIIEESPELMTASEEEKVYLDKEEQ